VTFSTSARVRSCLAGIATGDAIGKQTEMLTRAKIQHWYPDGVRGFEGKPGDIIPRYTANKKKAWRIGETTDDTERTIAVARAITTNRRVSHVDVGREMLPCTKCVHPGVASLWEFHQSGDPARIAERHDGCGAAIRVAPVGIVYPSRMLDAIVSGAWETSVPTHGGSLALAAAAATAAAVSSAIDGAPHDTMFHLATEAAALAQRRWPDASGRSFAGAMRAVHTRLAGAGALTSDTVAERAFPMDPLTIVPLALTLATLMNSAEEAILLATNVGGDSDSVASIAGGILGASHPDTVNGDWYQVVERVNGHDLTTLADELVLMRSAS
jgi:ADP-ribosylglycohydrolase